MTLSKNPGVYINETVSNYAVGKLDDIPLFIVETSTEIAGLDNVLTRFNNVSAFKTLVNGKGLNKTAEFIEHFFMEQENNSELFYVYSIKSNTSDGYKSPIVDTVHKKEIKSYYYFEETKSTTVTLADKISSIKTALISSNYNAHPAVAYIIPYGTVDDAVENKEEGADAKEVFLTATKNVSAPINSGRICVILPEDYCGVTAGKCYKTPYNEDVGFKTISSIIPSLKYQLTDPEILDLTNAGVLFLKEKLKNNTSSYGLNLGVTTSFTSDSSDGYLISRRIADELLRDAVDKSEEYVLDKTSDNAATFLNSDIKGIISEYASNEDVYKKETFLTATTGADGASLELNGEIKARKCITTITINCTLR